MVSIPPIVLVRLTIVRVNGALLESLLVAFTSVGSRSELLTDLDKRLAQVLIHVVTHVLKVRPRAIPCLVIMDPLSVCLPSCSVLSRLTSRRRLLEFVLARELIKAVSPVTSREVLALVVARLVVLVLDRAVDFVVRGLVLMDGLLEDGSVVSAMVFTENPPVLTQ